MSSIVHVDQGDRLGDPQPPQHQQQPPKNKNENNEKEEEQEEEGPWIAQVKSRPGLLLFFLS